MYCFGDEEGNHPPNTPTIDGPTNGKKGEEYYYTFITTDLDGNDVWYFIEWGDGFCEDWIGPYLSGQEITVSHTWAEEDTYTITAKAKDVFDNESDWATLEVTIPKNKPFNYNFNLLSWLFERFPHAFPMLRHLLGL